MAAVLDCPKCKTAFEVDPGRERGIFLPVSRKCAVDLQTFLFPAFSRDRETGWKRGGPPRCHRCQLLYHPQKQAAQVCDGCGRMICHLCSIDLSGRHLCPTCISSGRKKGKISTLENSRTRWDSLAFTLAIFGILLSFAAIILSPAAIYIANRPWNDPGSLVTGRSRTRVCYLHPDWRSRRCVFYAAFIAILIFNPHHHK